jgi:hypothetical protein
MTMPLILQPCGWRIGNQVGTGVFNLGAAVLHKGSTVPANLAVDGVEKNSVFFPMNSLIRPN